MEEPDEEAQVESKTKTKFMKKPQGLQISLSDDDSDERDEDKSSEEPTDKKAEIQVPVVPPIMDKAEQDENASKDKEQIEQDLKDGDNEPEKETTSE